MYLVLINNNLVFSVIDIPQTFLVIYYRPQVYYIVNPHGNRERQYPDLCTYFNCFERSQ